MARKPPVPPGLGTAGRKLWRAVLAAKDLSAGDLRVLEDACGEADVVAAIVAALEEHGEMIVQGSQGQPVPNPLLAELRQHRAVLNTLIRGLKLPQEGQDAASQARSASEAAQVAARAKWTKRTRGDVA